MAVVTILGAGSWGTALATHLARLGHEVALWARNPEFSAQLAAAGENAVYLPGVRFPPGLEPIASLAEACVRSKMVVFVCPSSAVRGMADATRPHLRGTPLVVSAVKGVEQETHLTMSAILDQVLGDRHRARVAVLSGPSFAREVGQGVPTAVTAAARDLAVAEAVQRLFAGETFRVYTSIDVAGVEIGGAVKNVIAVAAGVSDGLGFGHNTRAALITRGLAEITRLATRLGADRQTLYGLSGLGDLVLTCTGDLSRNRTVGLRLGRGERLVDIVASMKEVAEGVRNTRSVRDLARSVEVEMPITEQMYLLLYEDKPPRQVVVDLMTRGLKRETD
ncbi:MAG: NAD(P)-dependent glycerol-3-phosphate dehydrogenase [Deltaproteobacteria bacterium]|nr:MAG: NAD(P)-dependent glycerol-3-phosphate dehydrogenase [Deltaproteobacteria bacterium]